MNNQKPNRVSVFSYIKEQKGLALIILIVFVAVILLLWPSKSESVSIKDDQSRLEDYEQKIEGKLKSLCTKVRGASNVEVSVYFESGFELVYAHNEESKATSNGVDFEKKYIIVGSGDDEKMICLYEKMPSISGVAIVCKGGGNPTVANDIISLVSSALGVAKNKIYVAEGKN